ncbi:peptidoglycan-binding domain-containing protein [Coleofasciculus sp. F4-SAH-05]|uniref:peptidoglycan-binding domain-containing protein n=1 Tax=Coleofasciculus sp. F4-SAH-05 TaxID=3069525 RepID=UPI0032F22109
METLAYSNLIWASENPAEVGLESVNLDEWRLIKPSPVPFHWLLFAIILSSLGLTDKAVAQTLQQGSRGSQVMEMQQRLQDLGYFDQQPTGYFGPITTDAVQQFQRRNGLIPDGIVGQRTQSVLFDNLSRISPLDSTFASSTLPPPSKTIGTLPSPPTIGDIFSPTRGQVIPPPPIETQPSSFRELRPGDRGQDVFELQLKLRQAGFDPGPVDGIYSFQTQNAVEQFQEANNLFTDGVANQDTLQALGLIPTLEQNRYVVVVPIYNGDTLTRVQRYVSGAFTADSGRGKFVNAGSFADRDGAQEISHRLRSQGLDARVAYLR